ncbi:aspartate--tRNA ligase msd1 [Cladophialophora chaetospira]|uniref:Aspartate--tRNA ligase msd1 n=1 Tax=Cladophialophora chaetospira TaxID=386627 RepID=A0AA38X1L8_9EURO|nr:aspartate--tRNA ligase msd1 [Cladophialophora chaetospira]
MLITLVQWTEKYLPSAEHDLLSSGTTSISIADLRDISENRSLSTERLSLDTLKLSENHSGSGSAELRSNLASLYSARSGGVTADDILITNGGSAADYTVLSALLVPGDHVICQYPISELLYKLPTSLGAEVTRWNTDAVKRWRPDIDELKTLIRENTKVIIIQSPCDPTGAIVPKPILEALVEAAEEKDITVVVNETYRPLFHSISPSDDDFPPSAINLGYRKVVVTGTVAKAYSLAGIRAGWIATKDRHVIAACKRVRRIKSTAASTLDEGIAAESLSDRCIHALLGRNIKLCQTNLGLVQSFVEEHNWACSWVKPQAGTTAMLKFHKMGKPVDAEGFCLKLLEHAGLLVCPAGKCCGDSQALRGYVRVAFGGSTEKVQSALAAWMAFMEEHFESVPTVSTKSSTYIEISKYLHTRLWHCQDAVARTPARQLRRRIQTYSTTSRPTVECNTDREYEANGNLLLQQFQNSRLRAKVPFGAPWDVSSADNSSAWDKLRHFDADSLPPSTDPDSTDQQKVCLYGYITSHRPAKGLDFCQLVDPRLELAIQVVLPHDKGGSQMTRKRPHSPLRVSGTVVRRPEPQKRRTQQENVLGNQAALSAQNAVPILDPYVGQLSLISHIEIQADFISAFNTFQPAMVATRDTVLPPEQRHIQFRTDSDLRRRIRLRSQISGKIRQHMLNDDFDEIETPLLFKSTPEGAREFIVPTRKMGMAYALPQSPQQYKQVLMAAGIPRYFQFAKCFRDEDLRADRQPEFTQLDLEMAFAESRDVMKTVEDLLIRAVWPNVPGISPLQIASATNFNDAGNSSSEYKSLTFPILTYEVAMSRYGSDKPDTRLGSEIRRIDDWLPSNVKSMVTSLDDQIVEMTKIDLQGTEPAESQKFFRAFLDASKTARYTNDPARIPGMAVYDPLKPLHGLATFGHEGAAKVEEKFNPEPGDLLILWSREDKPFTGGSTVLGDLRRDVYQSAIAQGLIPVPSGFSPLWITEFPLFSPIEESEPGQGGSAGICSTHHPFTAPKSGQRLNYQRLKEEPLSIIGDHYDLVINGVEVGGGSCRIHRVGLQRMIFRDVLQMSSSSIREFDHLLDALSDGCPPHAGFALGFDRLMAMLTNSASVRDVIAFPKTADGEDKFVGSPSRVTPEQLATYHLTVAEQVNRPRASKISQKA